MILKQRWTEMIVSVKEERRKNGNNEENDDAIMKCQVGGSKSVKDALMDLC